MTPEQDKNLKEILGFDPDGTTEKDTPGKRSVASEQSLLPQNWSELFQEHIRSLYTDRIKAESQVSKKKPFAILSINESFDGGAKVEMAQRIYFAFKGDGEIKSDFTEATRLDVRHSEGEIINIYMVVNSDAYSFEYIKFEEDTSMKLGAGVVNRGINVTYRPDGTLEKITISSYSQEDAGRLPSESIVKFGQDGNVKDILEATDNKIEVERDSTIKNVHVRRLFEEEEVDDISIPIAVDIQRLKEDLFPDELLRNPEDPNMDLDLSWKGIASLTKVGVGWTPAGVDKEDSINPQKTAWSK